MTDKAIEAAWKRIAVSTSSPPSLDTVRAAIAAYERESGRDAEIAEWRQCAQVEAALRREARGEIARLREALKSFAEWLSHYERWNNKLDSSTLVNIPLGYLLSARSALAGEGRAALGEEDGK